MHYHIVTHDSATEEAIYSHGVAIDNAEQTIQDFYNPDRFTRINEDHWAGAKPGEYVSIEACDDKECEEYS